MNGTSMVAPPKVIDIDIYGHRDPSRTISYANCGMISPKTSPLLTHLKYQNKV